MKSIIPILLFFGLPFITYGEKVSSEFPKEVARLNRLAENGTKINDILKLKIDGFLGDGGFSFVYEGIYLADNRIVAIKFATNKRGIECEREFEMYTYLRAYKRPEVEKYGIPAVYYYGRWEGFTVMAITKLDKDLVDVANDDHELRSSLDVLLLIQNFIIQSKYMHSCGVRHDDIKPENIMIGGYKSFLIDFNLGSKMTEDLHRGTPFYASRRYHKKEHRCAIDDWESFLYSICRALRIPFGWFVPSACNVFHNIFEKRYVKNYKKKTNKIRNCINKYARSAPLKMVIAEFANEIYGRNNLKAFPNYDRLEKLVSNEITKEQRKGSTFPPMFSWLTGSERLEAKSEIDANPRLNITDIIEPSSINFEKFDYPVVEQLPPLDHDQDPMDSEKDIVKKLWRKSAKKLCFFSAQSSQ